MPPVLEGLRQEDCLEFNFLELTEKKQNQTRSYHFLADTWSALKPSGTHTPSTDDREDPRVHMKHVCFAETGKPLVSVLLTK